MHGTVPVPTVRSVKSWYGTSTRTRPQKKISCSVSSKCSVSTQYFLLGTWLFCAGRYRYRTVAWCIAAWALLLNSRCVSPRTLHTAKLIVDNLESAVTLTPWSDMIRCFRLYQLVKSRYRRSYPEGNSILDIAWSFWCASLNASVWPIWLILRLTCNGIDEI